MEQALPAPARIDSTSDSQHSTFNLFVSAHPPASAITQASARGAAGLYAAYGRTIKVATVDRAASYTAPRLIPQMDDSTVRVDRYSSTVRILKSEVTAITTPAGWVGVVIELPEGTGWRRYQAIPEQVQDVHINSEWKLDVESL